MNFKVLLGLAILCGVLLGAGAGAVTSRLRSSGPAAPTPAAAAGSQRAAAAPADAAQPAGGGTGTAQRAPGNQLGQAMAGTIESIDGNVLTLRLPNGNSVRVVVSDSTVIRRMVPGTLADLSAGQTITVAAERAEDGSATARMIQVVPEGVQAIQSVPRGQGQDGTASQDGGDQAGQRRAPQGAPSRQGGGSGGR